MNRRNVSPVVVTVFALTAVSMVLAAAPKEEQRDEKSKAGDSAARTTDRQADWKVDDQMLASCVALENQEEIAIAQFALKQTKNEDVREFAQMLVDDHSSFLKKLEKFAPEATQDGFLKEDDADRTTQTESKGKPRKVGELGDKGQAEPNIVTRVAAKPPLKDGSIDPMELQRELAEQCLSDTKAMLTKKGAEKFDECFIGLQIAKHAAMKSKLDVMQRHASSELADILSNGRETTAMHLAKAEKLMEQLAKDNRETAAK